jgi:hypothetical protein
MTAIICPSLYAHINETTGFYSDPQDALIALLKKVAKTVATLEVPVDSGLDFYWRVEPELVKGEATIYYARTRFSIPLKHDH